MVLHNRTFYASPTKLDSRIVERVPSIDSGLTPVTVVGLILRALSEA
jgi:hypothetical protein